MVLLCVNWTSPSIRYGRFGNFIAEPTNFSFFLNHTSLYVGESAIPASMRTSVYSTPASSRAYLGHCPRPHISQYPIITPSFLTPSIETGPVKIISGVFATTTVHSSSILLLLQNVQVFSKKFFRKVF